jgi:hypothetical protein
MFDATTGLLSRVRYLGGAQGNTPIEIQYSNWKTVAGQAVAGSLARVVGGAVEFTLTSVSTSFAPAADASIFTIP